MLKKIISGGQIGADIAGLIVGKEFGLETGGCMPNGFLTKSGPRPEYVDMFGVYEHKSPKYPPRTYENAKMSDGTIRFANNFNSRGELCTLKAIKQYDKPYFDVDIDSPPPVSDLIGWIVNNKIETLNVAGNANKETFDFVMLWLHIALKSLV